MRESKNEYIFENALNFDYVNLNLIKFALKSKSNQLLTIEYICIYIISRRFVKIYCYENCSAVRDNNMKLKLEPGKEIESLKKL